MHRNLLEIGRLQTKSERIYPGIGVRRAAALPNRGKVNGHGAEKHPNERICSGNLWLLSLKNADFAIFSVLYPTSNG